LAALDRLTRSGFLKAAIKGSTARGSFISPKRRAALDRTAASGASSSLISRLTGSVCPCAADTSPNIQQHTSVRSTNRRLTLLNRFMEPSVPPAIAWTVSQIFHFGLPVPIQYSLQPPFSACINRWALPAQGELDSGDLSPGGGYRADRLRTGRNKFALQEWDEGSPLPAKPVIDYPEWARWFPRVASLRVVVLALNHSCQSALTYATKTTPAESAHASRSG
jgi:hypothetical protein